MKKHLKFVLLIITVLLLTSCSKPNSEDANNLFDDGLLEAKIGDSYGYIDSTGKFAINPQFSDVGYSWDGGLMAVESQGKWGYINKKGEYVINHNLMMQETLLIVDWLQ